MHSDDDMDFQVRTIYSLRKVYGDDGADRKICLIAVFPEMHLRFDVISYNDAGAYFRAAVSMCLHTMHLSRCLASHKYVMGL